MKPDDMPGNGFDYMQLTDWRQFGDVNIDFHPRLTVLTGANASGKTTILNILGRHFDWRSQFLSTPRWSSSGLDWQPNDVNTGRIGELGYWNNTVSPIKYTLSTQAEANLELVAQAEVKGVYISSHRTTGQYSRLQTIPAEFSAVSVIFQQFWTEILNRYVGGYSAKSPLTAMKESLLAAALYGGNREDIEHNPAAASVWAGYQDALRKSLPQSFGFERLMVRAPEILVSTTRGEFLIDSVSGGISAIMELTWQIYLRSWELENFTVCIDEPENHLHPSLQRSLIPGLLEAFPNISFVIATHSPFIVTSVPDSNVYVLASQNDDGGKINSLLLDTANKSATADETLRRVLGVPTTIPIWAENELEQLVASLDGPTFVDKVRQVQQALARLGLENQLPAALDVLENGSADA